MMHRFWLWLNLRSQKEIVKSARREREKRLVYYKRERDALPYEAFKNGQLEKLTKFYQAQDRLNAIQRFIEQEEYRLNMMGGLV
jgi:hypothetical protein